jgi:hypothetical protein
VYQTGFSKDPLDYRPLNDEFKFSIKVPTDGEIVLRYSDGKVSKSGNYVALMGKSLPLFHFLAEPNRTFSFGVFDNLYAYAKMYGKTLRVLDDDEVSRVFKVSKDAAAQMLVFGVKDLDPSTSIQFPTEDAYSAVLTFPENNGLFSPYLKGPYTKLSKGDPKAFGLMKDAFGPLYEAKGENFRVVRQDGLPGVSEDAFKKQYDSPPQDPKDTPKAVEPEKSNKLLWILGGITLTAAVAYAIHRSKTEEI